MTSGKGEYPRIEPDPTVGRIVHYVHDETCRAAIVTEVLDGGPGIGIDSLGLCVLLPHGMFFCRNVAFDDKGTRLRTWHWPERT